MDNIPIGAELVAAIGGMFLPWVINVIKQQSWGDTLRTVVAFIMCVLWTALAFWLTDVIGIDETGIDPKQIALTTLGVFFVAHITYKTYWQANPPRFSLGSRA